MGWSSLRVSPLTFLSCRCPPHESRIVLIGCPFDLTSSFRPGSRFAPSSIRQASWNLESFSPGLQRDLEGAPVADLGDLEPSGTPEKAIREIEEAISEVVSAGKLPFLLGGEHLISLGAVRALKAAYEGLTVLQVDAHADLRDQYLGAELSHATVMRRVVEELGAERVFQVGVRSWAPEEWRWAKAKGTFLGEGPDTPIPRELQEVPLYLTVDLDVLDPGVCPGVGTPEPGGWTFKELESFLGKLPFERIVGVDVVELSPPFDPSGVSSVVAAKVVRELLLSLL